jgi:hypothetical protein
MAAGAAGQAVRECEAFRAEAEDKLAAIRALKEAIDEHASEAEDGEQICEDSKNDARIKYFSAIRETDLAALEAKLQEVEAFAATAT